MLTAKRACVNSPLIPSECPLSISLTNIYVTEYQQNNNYFMVEN